MAYELVDITNSDIIQQVWEKGIVVEHYDASLYRKDSAGAWIARQAYGDKNSILGWEIDHVYPISRGGQSHMPNLRPMNWRNNASKGDDYPGYTAAVISDGNRNIYQDTAKTVNHNLQSILSELYNL